MAYDYLGLENINMNNIHPLNKSTDSTEAQSAAELIHAKDISSNKRWIACLLSVAQTQDREAFSYLYQHFAPRLKSFFLQKGTIASEAEELIQEAFVTIWQKAHYYSAEKSYVSTWIYTIARNKKLDRDRKSMRFNNYVNDMQHEEPKLSQDDPFEYSSSSQLRSLVQELPEPQPMILRSVYFEGKSHQQTANEMNLTLGTVKGQIRNAITRLKHLTRSEA